MNTAVEQPRQAGKASGMDDAAAERTGEKWCPKCKRWLPADLEHFYNDPRGKLGLSCWCKECQRARGRQRKKEQREAVKLEKVEAAASAVMDASNSESTAIEGADVSLQDSKVIKLDFTDHPVLLEAIKALAVGEFRVPEQQIMYFAAMGVMRQHEEDVPFWAKEQEEPA